MKGIFIGLLLLFCNFIFAQSDNNSIRLITKLSGSDFGISYPYVTKMNKYALQNSHVNIGVRGAFLFGRAYPSGITLSCEPSLFIESVQQTTFKREYFNQTTNKLTSVSEISDQHHMASILLPAAIDIKIGKRISIGSSIVFSLPFGGSGKYLSQQKRLNHKFEYYITDNVEFDYIPEIDLGIGFSSRILFSIGQAGNRQQFIGLSYYHEFTPRYPAGINTKSFTVSFLTRNLVTKEVRHKWDRYIMRHQ
ncbi:MAG TPA: hypothetical protein VFG10_16360 [Saprospiraceae bacterium]|nr:hypothetical protein [Saprospiraceae bacterium]